MLDKALHTAIDAHSKQFRKGTSIPYIVHPLNVARMAQEFEENEKVIVACLLHDTLEDTKYTPTLLEEDFGKEILEMVQGVSEDKSISSWHERKMLYLKHLKETDNLDAIKVSIYDKIDNLRSLVFDYAVYGEKLWARFNAGKNEQIWFYESFLRAIEKKHIDPFLKTELSIWVEKFIRNISKGQVEITKEDSPWEFGRVGNYSFEAKVFDNGSKFGMNGGRISKLAIYNGRGECVFEYDRGGVCYAPFKRAETEKILGKILDFYTNEV